MLSSKISNQNNYERLISVRKDLFLLDFSDMALVVVSSVLLVSLAQSLTSVAAVLSDWRFLLLELRLSLLIGGRVRLHSGLDWKTKSWSLIVSAPDRSGYGDCIDCGKHSDRVLLSTLDLYFSTCPLFSFISLWMSTIFTVLSLLSSSTRDEFLSIFLFLNMFLLRIFLMETSPKTQYSAV